MRGVFPRLVKREQARADSLCLFLLNSLQRPATHLLTSSAISRKLRETPLWQQFSLASCHLFRRISLSKTVGCVVKHQRVSF